MSDHGGSDTPRCLCCGVPVEPRGGTAHHYRCKACAKARCPYWDDDADCQASGQTRLIADGGVAVEKTTRRDPEDLPILSHTEVLGVDIAVPQEAHHKEMQGEDSFRNNLEVRIEAWQGEIGKKRVERHLSHWARRNLFDGAGPE